MKRDFVTVSTIKRAIECFQCTDGCAFSNAGAKTNMNSRQVIKTQPSRFIACRRPEFATDLKSNTQPVSGPIYGPKSSLMSFLAFPSSAILVLGVVWLDFAKAFFAGKDPGSILGDPNSKKGTKFFLAKRTTFFSDTFDRHRFAQVFLCLIQ